jgi:ABC-type sugar transport system ATPase subunit
LAEVRVHQVSVRVPAGEQARAAPRQPESVGPVAGLTAALAPAELALSAPASGPALDHVDLVLHDGETVAVLGPSGCGKTTLLRVVAGLQRPDRGEVWFDDQEVTALPAGERGIGMVFQNYALYPHMKGRGNLDFFFKVHHRDKEIEDRVNEVAQILGVGFKELLDRRPSQLSGGQQQRVAIGRAIIRQPTVFLFDEPLSNLDARLRQTTRVEIKRLLRRFGISALYVTHDQTEAMALGDRIAVMRRGRVEQIGSYRQVYADPVSLFVATFLGSPPCNIVPAELGQGTLHIDALALAGVPGSRVHNGKVLAGIRAEAFTLGLSGTGRGPTFRCIVQRVEGLPSEHSRLVTTVIGGRSVVARVGRSAEAEDLRAGDAISLTVSPDEVLLFDAVDGQRLRP